MAKVWVHPEAVAQVRQIDQWWRNNTGRPRLFSDEWKHAKEKLRALPLIGGLRPGRADQHRLLLQGSKYYVYYVYIPPPRDVIHILEVRSNYQDDGSI